MGKPVPCSICGHEPPGHAATCLLYMPQRVRVAANQGSQVSEKVILSAPSGIGQEVPFFSTAEWGELVRGIDIIYGSTEPQALNAIVRVYAYVGAHKYEVRRARGHILTPTKPGRVLHLRDTVADRFDFTVQPQVSSLLATPPSEIFFAICGTGYEPERLVRETRWVNGDVPTPLPAIQPGGFPPLPGVSQGLVSPIDCLIHRVKAAIEMTAEAGPYPVWLQFFDLPAAPVANQVCNLPGLDILITGNGEVAAGPTRASDAGASWIVNNQLWWALSQTPYIFTPLGAGITMNNRVDAEVS